MSVIAFIGALEVGGSTRLVGEHLVGGTFQPRQERRRKCAELDAVSAQCVQVILLLRLDLLWRAVKVSSAGFVDHRLLRENGLKAIQKRRFKKTTDSNYGGRIAANLLDQDFACDGPDQKWGVDISYVWTAEGWLYLAIVLDFYSRRTMLEACLRHDGWATSSRLKRDLALSALHRAIAMRGPPREEWHLPQR